MKSSIKFTVLFPALAAALAMASGCGGVVTAPNNTQASTGAGASAPTNSGSGTTGTGTTTGGTTGSGTSTTGTGTSTGTTGSGTTGSGSTGSGTTGSGTSGSGTTGSGTTGSGTTGSGTTGSGTTGSGTTGSGSTGSGTTGSGTTGSGTTGSGTTGSGTTGSGTTGSGTTGSGTTGSGTTSTDPYPDTVPADATVVSGIQALSNWQSSYDTGTSGSSSGATELVADPTLSGQTRQFDSTYTKSGGERYFVSFGADTTATNFFYDVWVYLPATNPDIANLEFDMNQTMANGQTVIYGFQCDGYSNTWDYTENAGTPTVPVDRWVHSSASCNVQNWSINTWHHLQVSYFRDDEGNVTYDSVWLDNTQQSINETVPSAFALGWGSSLLTNFQVDGLGASGSSQVYLDNMTVYRW